MSRRRARRWGGLDIEALRSRWGRDDVYVYGSVDSTNAIARELADRGAPAGTLVLAREQTAGRGRGRNRWQSPADAGVYLSMVFRPRGSEVRPLLTVLAGLGVVSELDRRYPGLDPRLKWPNDILVGSRKLGGILTEASQGDSGAVLIVGVGINVRTEALPASLRVRAVGLDAVADTTLPDGADAVVAGLERFLPDPPEALEAAQLEELDRYDGLKNRRVRLLPPEGDPVLGTAAGIAPDGALLFRPDRGALRRVVTGSVELQEEVR